MMRGVRGWAVVAFVLFGAAPARAAELSPSGSWLTQDGDGVIEIAPCAEALCGRIAGIRRGADEPIPLDASGASQCGLTILRDELPQPDGTWLGRITDPRDGRTYGAQLWLDDTGRLHIRGYIGVPIFGRTQIWTRFEGAVGGECRF